MAQVVPPNVVRCRHLVGPPGMSEQRMVPAEVDEDSGITFDMVWGKIREAQDAAAFAAQGGWEQPMDAHERHVGVEFARMAMGIGMLIFGIFVAVFVCWLILSEPKTKLYESDNMVCANAPLVQDCFERKPR